ncbi:NAD(P)H-dependent glycerol-3-phosphate dehydrogenase [Undibacterium fentianense]|uniref:Glycerol-3-phosphate dehydrogenase [NAD(P)+] n=1 Tax=Undibacterium fentianense TaxID=2828728 RepID=A0A941E3J8_9BURK|nr:NAD(P)H-dependent glycerol-3-phosphate dehydrogenase [Undibacterium fentianense]MBR7800442.1 NAD(P)-dependent glycerol-3-phosphate dehydrogenase [Undibacterium fentianense]
MKITVLGAGAWGTALAISLAAKNQVILWGRNETALHEAQKQRENQHYLPGYPFPQNLNASADFDAAIRHALDDGLLIIASSVSGLRPILQQCKPYRLKNIVWLCKGFEEGSRLLPHQVVKEELGEQVLTGALSGPSFAQEVAQGLPCALTIASTSVALCQLVVNAAHSPSLRIYSSDDVIGVEVGGAVKNILAIATGVADGLGLGLNARAALMTRGLAEISRLSNALGGRSETLMGLTGVGDLILTCTGSLSRNRKVGLALAEGKSLDRIIQDLGHVAEGVRCAQAVQALAQERQVEMPITNAVASVLFEHVPAREMIDKLLSREAKTESK